jgi:hypothetical protein
VLRLKPVDLSTLTSAITGRVLTPGDDDYLDAATVARGPGSPLAVVQPAEAADVAAAVGFARDAGLELSVRGGGHDSPAVRRTTAASSSTCARSPASTSTATS